MLKSFKSLALGALAASTLAGCGGGSASNTDAGQTTNLGQISVVSDGELKAFVGSGSNGVTVTAVSGSLISTATLNPTQTLANTQIAIAEPQQIHVLQNGIITPISSATAAPVDVAYSHNGTLAYIGAPAAGGANQVFTCNYDGSSVSQITNTKTQKSELDWSPTNSGIAYADSSGDMYLNNLSGTAEAHLAANGYAPTFSPDGKKLVFAGYKTNGEIDLYDIATATASAFYNPTGHDFALPRFSPDGQAIIFEEVQPNAVEAYTLHNTGVFYLSSATLACSKLYRPTYSPDGKYVAIIGVLDAGGWELFITDLSGNLISSYPVPNGTTIAWSPFYAAKRFIGTSGQMFTSADGFLWGQAGSGFASLSAFTTTGNKPATITAQPSGGGALVYDINVAGTGNLVTGMKYTNNYYGQLYSYVPNSSDVLVAFDPATGQVATVAPFSIEKGAVLPKAEREGPSLIYKGRFTAAYDAKGKNLALGGVGSIKLDAMTGALVGVRK